MDALLNAASYFFWVAVALGILVFVHELGHFLFARLFGMRVDAFAIGFPPVVLRKQVGATEYRLGAVPLGGYVKIAGMVDESLDTDNLASEPEPDEYRAKPVWQRALVISGGVLFNLALAFLVFIGLALWYGEAYTPAENVRAVYVAEGSPAAAMGLQTGDRVVAVNGEPLERFEAILAPEHITAGAYRLTVERGGETLTLEAPRDFMGRLNQGEPFGLEPGLPPVLGAVQPGSPADEAGLEPGDQIVAVGGAPVRYWAELTSAVRATGGEAVPVRWARPEAQVDAADPAPVAQGEGFAYYEAPIAPRPSGDGETYLLGVQNDASALGVRYRRYGLGEAITAGTANAWTLTTSYVTVFGRLFTGRENVRESVGGPLMIAKATKEAADQGMQSFWLMVAMLSIALAVFNILPIPVLDGGHLVFLAYEAVARREPSLKFRIATQQVGMALLIAFMVFVIFNDAVRWFG